MLAHSFLNESSSKLLVSRTDIKARTSSISGLWFPWPIYMFFEMRFNLGTLDSGVQLLPFGLLVYPSHRSEKGMWDTICQHWWKLRKPLSGMQDTIFFVIARPCWMYALLRPHSIVRYFNRVWITSSVVFTRLCCFRMLNVDKMKHWNSSRDRFQNQWKTSLKC